MVSAPPMLPPYSACANRSKLIELLDKGHEDVKLSRAELDKLAAWIDLIQKLNQIRSQHAELRQGETLFSAICASDPAIVNYVRKSPAGISLLALNADNEAKTATLRLLQPGMVRCQRGGHPAPGRPE